jgi:hypothetical protein
VGHCGAEISNSFTHNKSKSISLEGFETTQFQTECVTFRSPARMGLYLKFRSLVMVTSTQTYKQLQGVRVLHHYQWVYRPLSLLTAMSVMSFLPWLWLIKQKW